MDPIDVVRRFNTAINDRDPDRLASLMADDHTFTDAAGGTAHGKQACVRAWRGFFAAFPDYRNTFTGLIARDDVVAVSGHSACARPELAGPALWSARVTGSLVAEWRVHEDTPAARHELGLPPAG